MVRSKGALLLLRLPSVSTALGHNACKLAARHNNNNILYMRVYEENRTAPPPPTLAVRSDCLRLL